MKIKKLVLLTADLNATANFYSGTLALPIIENTEHTVSFVAGSSILQFIKTSTGKPVYHFAFNIPHNQIVAALEWAKKRLEIIPETPGNIIADFKTWNATAFYFYDNNKNIVEFIARFDLPNASSKQFTGASIVSISEAGIPVADVKAICDNLRNCYGLNYFSKQPPMTDFAALGDEEGLLIFVSTNRNWYPTNQPSDAFYVKVSIDLNGDQVEIKYHDE